MHSNLNNSSTVAAPPLETIHSPPKKALLANNNDTMIINDPPFTDSTSSSSTNTANTSRSPSSSNTSASSRSCSLKPSMSLSAINGIQNINILDNHYDDNNNDQNIQNNQSNEILENNNLRRSKRINKKRKLGIPTFYTAKSWKPFQTGPPSKKRKTGPSASTNTLHPRVKIKAKPKAINKSSPKSQSCSNLQSFSKQLQEQNGKMRIMHKSMMKKKINWIKYNFSSFEPFLEENIIKRYKPRSSEIDALHLESCKDYTQQPDLLEFGELRDYQLRSLNWLRLLRNNGCPAILADEMGLGKTIQSIACISSFLTDNFDVLNNKQSPSLIIAPLSVADAWLTEFNRWLPSLRCILFHGSKVQRENIVRNELIYSKFDIVITTYEIAVSSKTILSKYWWNYLILDEAHKIKNEKTTWHQVLKLMNNKSLYCVLLTGTPIQNNMHELYALLSFILPEIFIDSNLFDKCYMTGGSDKQIQNKLLLSKAPYLLRPFFLRRLKEEVELTLPPKEEIILKINMSHKQRNYYKNFLCAYASLIDEVSDEHSKNVSTWKKVRHLYMELRKISLHPFLLADLKHKISIKNGKEIIEHSSKLQILDKLLHKLIKNSNPKHRILIFSCFTLVLDLLEVYCAFRDYKYLRLDGSTPRLKRKIDIMRFNDDPNSKFDIYLISNRAGGLGINLQSADTVIHFDSDWNPQSDLQAQARAHRIGQKNMVKIYRIISSNTVEERILFRSQQKLYLDAVVSKGAKMVSDDNNIQFDLNNQDLLESIKFGAQKMFVDDDNNDIHNIDINLLLDRSHKIKNNDNSILLKDLSSQNNVKNFNFSMKLLSGNVFEGKTYKKKVDDSSFNNNNEIDYSKTKRLTRNTNKSRIITIDGMKFESRIEENPLIKFYKQCSNDIHDTKNNQAFHHEISKCWGCDESIHGLADDKIIKCQTCPKVFHSSIGKHCWQGEKTKLGVFICSQHRCHKCGLGTSETGMILRCLGCQLSFCYECSPAPHWSTTEDDGLYFLDNCVVAEHFNYYLPQSSYQYIFCSSQCKKFYNIDYSRRSLPDLSIKYNNLPDILLDIIEEEEEEDSRRSFNNLSIDSRIASYNEPFKLIDRLKQILPSNCQLISELYDILYEINIYNENEEEKDIRDCIRDEHYLKLNEIKDKLSPAVVNVPQWNQCISCKKWRIININISQIFSWKNDPQYLNWDCSKNDDSFNCNSIQITPSKQSHSGNDLKILRLQRELMNIQYQIVFNNKNNKNQEKSIKYSAKLSMIKHKISCVCDIYKLKNLIFAFNELRIALPDYITSSHISEARYQGLSEWNGYPMDNPNEICKYYQHLCESFRHWRIESLKTLMDNLGFLIETKKKIKGYKNAYYVEKIALSYNKEKIIQKLAIFLIYPINKHLIATTKDFRK